MKDDENAIVLSLYDHSGNMVRPWAENGYECYAVDIKHEDTSVEKVGEGCINYIEADIRNWLPPRRNYRITFAFPPCTNLAVSGARWFNEKGLDGLSEGIELVERAREISEWTDSPWMIENPVSTLSTYWREPNYIFHPYEYDGFTSNDEAYTKKTCLWTNEGFEMPKKCPSEEYDNRIHSMPPSEDRAEKRSVTPSGFAKSVYLCNEGKIDTVESVEYSSKDALEW